MSAGDATRAYRVFLFGVDGHIVKVHEIEAASDAAAYELGSRLLEDSHYPRMEVWDRARRVTVEGLARPAERVPKRLTSEDARRWRMKAEELRTAADQFQSATARQTMRSLAETYERLADEADRHSKRLRRAPPEEAG